MTDPRHEDANQRKRRKMREKAEDMSNLELLKLASEDWEGGENLDDVERDELAKEYRRRTRNHPENYDLSDN